MSFTNKMLHIFHSVLAFRLLNIFATQLRALGGQGKGALGRWVWAREGYDGGTFSIEGAGKRKGVTVGKVCLPFP